MENHATLPLIKVIGVGGGGCNAVSRMTRTRLPGVEYLAMNTDLQALERCRADVKLRMGDRLTRGLGAGADTERGARAAEESRALIAEAVAGAEMAFITTCLGGGTGTGASPTVAAIAREAGALTIGVATKPFAFEGARRRAHAETGAQSLLEQVDTLILIPNDRLLDIAGATTSVEQGFERADDVLREGIEGISELITKPGMVNLDFADVRKVMSDAGPAVMAVGTARGQGRALAAAKRAVSSPLLELGIDGASGVLFNVAASELRLSELEAAARVISEHVDPDAEIVFGTCIDRSMGDELRLTLIATGFRAAQAGARTTSDHGLMPADVPSAIRLGEILSAPVRASPAAEMELPTFLRRRSSRGA